MKTVFWCFVLAMCLVTHTASACSPVSLLRINARIQENISAMGSGQVLYRTFRSLTTLLHNKQELFCSQPSQQAAKLMVWGRMHGTMGASQTWPTSVQGVGIRVAIAIVSKNQPDMLHWLPFSSELSLHAEDMLNSDNIWLRIELVKTESSWTRSSAINFQQPSMLTFKWGEQLSTIAFSFTGITLPGNCQFTQPTTHIVLLPVKQSDLDEGGNSAAAPFPLDLQCSSPDLKPELTLYGMTRKNLRNVFVNTITGNRAQGVGIQVLLNNQPIEEGKPIKLNDIKFAGDKFKIPLFIRYHKVGKITPGDVKTHLTLKINYL
ncbi:fimbrial protein [Citrobacter arsenatis]|uniref:fimbrial protein n=1 Tax=Citrobacter arsenatis TaxID=2546350 RepID=UPI00300DCC2B